MTTQDIRWIQRLQHFAKALDQLRKAVEKDTLNELEEQGLIQTFEYTYELSWNMLKDYLEDQGDINITGSRDAFRLAFKRELIEEGEIWMDMVRSRTLTSHTYHEELAEKVADAIRQRYYPQFVLLQARMESLKESLA